jgi:hypothetical protein
MMSRTIEVIVSPQGESRVETKGFAGASCQAASQFLEQALGVRTNAKLTTEYYQHEIVSERLQQGGAS